MKSYSQCITMYLQMHWFVMKKNGIKHLHLKSNFLMYINKVHINLTIQNEYNLNSIIEYCTISKINNNLQNCSIPQIEINVKKKDAITHVHLKYNFNVHK